ncbi:MAG: 2-amino-4-hydroxy-6-hydroxymethyldihydropteridine diphosphokinase [Hyphomicrobiaceae bacterium]
MSHIPDQAATESDQVVLVALGSNLGDREGQMRRAVTALAGSNNIRVRSVSRLYETAPVGGPEKQGPFLNAALLGESSLSPVELLCILHKIEAEHDRERTIRWGPRTLDLDLLICGDVIVSSATLDVPHPRMHLRRFVMVPVCDIASDLVHPTLGRTMKDILDELPKEPGDLKCVADDWTGSKAESDTA